MEKLRRFLIMQLKPFLSVHFIHYLFSSNFHSYKIIRPVHSSLVFQFISDARCVEHSGSANTLEFRAAECLAEVPDMISQWPRPHRLNPETSLPASPRQPSTAAETPRGFSRRAARTATFESTTRTTERTLSSASPSSTSTSTTATATAASATLFTFFRKTKVTKITSWRRQFLTQQPKTLWPTTDFWSKTVQKKTIQTK